MFIYVSNNLCNFIRNTVRRLHSHWKGAARQSAAVSISGIVVPRWSGGSGAGYPFEAKRSGDPAPHREDQYPSPGRGHWFWGRCRTGAVADGIAEGIGSLGRHVAESRVGGHGAAGLFDISGPPGTKRLVRCCRDDSGIDAVVLAGRLAWYIGVAVGRLRLYLLGVGQPFDRVD